MTVGCAVWAANEAVECAQRDVVVLHPFRHLVWACADRLSEVILAPLSHGVGDDIANDGMARFANIGATGWVSTICTLSGASTFTVDRAGKTAEMALVVRIVAISARWSGSSADASDRCCLHRGRIERRAVLELHTWRSVNVHTVRLGESVHEVASDGSIPNDVCA